MFSEKELISGGMPYMYTHVCERAVNNKGPKINPYETPCFSAPFREWIFSCIRRFYFNFLFSVS
jgi:hypothetical protein